MKTLLVFVLLFSAVQSPAETHYVSLLGSHTLPYLSWTDAATNIQAAIDAAMDGDTVLVDSGTYLLSVPIAVSKGIKVRGNSGAASTVLRAPRGSAFTITNSGAVIDGFTIADANHPFSGPGGIYMVGGTVQYCIVSNCLTRSSGSGIYMSGGVVKHTLIEKNGFPGGNVGRGGGIYCIDGGRIENCTIKNNGSELPGGGVWLSGSTMSNCVVVGNTGEDGGGVYSINSTIVECVISSNSAYGYLSRGYGGGVYLSGGILERSKIQNNSSGIDFGGYAGGVFCTSNGLIRSCLVAANTAKSRPFVGYEYDGGGVYLASGTILSCTISGNACEMVQGGAIQAGRGGGIFVASGAVLNVISYFNAATSGANWFGPVGWFNFCCTTPDPDGLGNITADPQFANVAGGDYHLAGPSPCIDSGLNESWMIDASDLDKLPRVIQDRVDIGAYESLRFLLRYDLNLGLVLNAPTGFAYRVEFRDSLSPAAPWNALSTVTPSTNPWPILTSPLTNRSRFFRAIYP